MKQYFFLPLILVFSSGLVALAQNQISLTSTWGSENTEIRDLLDFQMIDYVTLSFTGNDLKGKHYLLSVKEIWNGKITDIDTIINSGRLGAFAKIQDTVFSFRMVAQKTENEKLKMQIKLPGFMVSTAFDAADADDYSLREISNTQQQEIEIGKPFYMLVYMLPYEEGNRKYYCAVESSGKNIESWGEEFGIEHYLIFEMEFN